MININKDHSTVFNPENKVSISGGYATIMKDIELLVYEILKFDFITFKDIEQAIKSGHEQYLDMLKSQLNDYLN